MDQNKSKIALPSLERAMKDLQEYDDKYKEVIKKNKELANEVRKFKQKKDNLEASIEKNNSIINLYENLHMTIADKLDNVLLNQNKAELVVASNIEKIKQVESKLQSMKPNFEELKALEPDLLQMPKLQQQNEDLQLKKEQLEKDIFSKNNEIKEICNKLS